MLTDIDYNALEFVIMRMRDCDKQEIYALRDHDNPLQLAAEAHYQIRNKGRGKVSWVNGRPAAIAAFTEEWPGVWYVWMFGTEEFRAAAIPLLRWIRQEANEILSVCSGHRLHCDSMMGHDEAHKMIKAMGGLPEGPPMRRLGKNKQDFQRFVWLKGENEEILKPHYVRTDNVVSETRNNEEAA